MFDKIIRELKKLEQPRQISVAVPLDDKGYIDRLCPSKQCGRLFKVLFDDLCGKVSEGIVYCPFCRHGAESSHWNTETQQHHINSAARAEIGRLVNGALSKHSNYKPGHIPSVIPSIVSEALRQDFTCEECNCRYASRGASFFCPACGHNSAESCFNTTLQTVRNTINAISDVQTTVEKNIDADAATDVVRQIVEDQIPRLVGAFERLNDALFQKMPNAGQFVKKGNLFQRPDDASSVWLKAAGKHYGDFLTASEFQLLKLWFQRRHLLSHKQGNVDQLYLDRSGDTTYAVGQRLVVRNNDVLEFTDILEKLATGLRELV